MKILMISWEYPPKIVGGISRVVYDLAHKLSEDENNEVHVVTLWDHGAKEFEKEGNVYVHRVFTYNVQPYNFEMWVLQMNYAIIEYCIRLINEYGKFDIIHAHDWIVCYAATVIKHAYTIPCVATVHATEHGRNWGIHNDTQRYIHNVEWFLTYEAWKVIVNSHYMKNEVNSIFSLPDDKVRIIPNGVDHNKFNGVERDLEFRRKYALDKEKIVFFVGRLVNEKGVQILIDAVPKIISHYYDTKVIIAGKGPELENLKTKTRWMNISDKVYFTGYISDEDLAKLYKCADIAVFPSLYEPFGIVALEGIVAGANVVVSDTGGLGEIINHGVDGMKSFTGNANSLADSIIEILYNSERAEDMKKEAIAKVKNIYNWDIIAKSTMDVYKEVLEEVKNSTWRSKVIKEEFKEA
jgi:glycogen synthase